MGGLIRLGEVLCFDFNVKILENNVRRTLAAAIFLHFDVNVKILENNVLRTLAATILLYKKF